MRVWKTCLSWEDRREEEVHLRHSTGHAPTAVSLQSRFCLVLFSAEESLPRMNYRHLQSPSPQLPRSKHLILSVLPPKYFSVLSCSSHLQLCFTLLVQTRLHTSSCISKLHPQHWILWAQEGHKVHTKTVGGPGRKYLRDRHF